jgi:SAM-dependent methyltransferase
VSAEPAGDGVVEGGVIAGNYENKYQSQNPVARWLMAGFLDTVTGLAVASGCDEALEVGCGEGLLAIELSERARLRIVGTDFSRTIIERARDNARQRGSSVAFETLDVDRLGDSEPLADLVVCCEVLEHLRDPERSLATLARVARKRLLLSVPREPLWRVLNVARGKYWRDLGNTPGHLNHWSAHGFVRLVERHARVLEVRQPLPWTVILAEPRR